MAAPVWSPFQADRAVDEVVGLAEQRACRTWGDSKGSRAATLGRLALAATPPHSVPGGAVWTRNSRIGAVHRVAWLAGGPTILWRGGDFLLSF